MEKVLPEKFKIVEELLEKIVLNAASAIAIKQISPEGKSIAREYSYLELFHYTNKIANSLREIGILPEQRIAIMLNDGFEFVACFIASLKIGAVPILLSTYYEEKLIEFILNDARAKSLFIDAEYVKRVSSVRGSLKHTKHLVSTTGFDGIESMEAFTRHSGNEAEMEDVSRDDVAFWFFTSGSTGNPKGVVHLHRDLYYAGLTLYQNTLRATNKDIFFSSAKLYFSAGMGFGLYGPLLLGASTVLLPSKPSAEILLGLISRVKPSMFLGVPSIYLRMLQEFGSEKYDLSSIRLFISGGEPLSPQIFSEWKKKIGKEITDGIGSAEVCHFFTMNIPGCALPGSVGKMLEGYEARVVDGNWNDLKANEIGLLLIKGKSTFAHYWHNQDATRLTLLGEWVNTGDLAYLDDEGFLFFCGRTDHSFKVNGLWVSPVQIENEIAATSLVRESCVIPRTTSDGLIFPVAYLVLRSESDQKDDVIQKLSSQLRGKLSSYKIPKDFVFLESLPRTTVDKIDRSLLLRHSGDYFQ
ncbi:MAG: benzoate-CoA ligase family protein [Nitrososphaerales archaeon]